MVVVRQAFRARLRTGKRQASQIQGKGKETHTPTLFAFRALSCSFDCVAGATRQSRLRSDGQCGDCCCCSCCLG
jgi:hypothetical protein